MALFPGLPGSAGTRKKKPIWILLKQETVSGSGISWAICKSAPRSRQITTPAAHHSVFYRPDALPAAHQQRQSTEGKSAKNNETNKNGGNVKIPHAKTMLKIMESIDMAARPLLSESYYTHV